MWWRVTSREWEEGHGKGNRQELKTLVDHGEEPALLAFEGNEPIGWIAVAPRSEYPRLDRSPKLRPVDDQPVWSITCFYIDRHHRKQGVAKELLLAAVDYAASNGAQVIEAYPIDTSRLSSPTSASLYTGTLAMFEEAGFREVARRGGRPIVRFATK
ncbi:MAG: GNAT family N-acetyltransferase [Actinobacteria bacterium]|nr:GNAT family N-acetyltransferase [Actinomycetota bacterium]